MSLGTSIARYVQNERKVDKTYLGRHHNYNLKYFVKNKVITEDSILTYLLAQDCGK